MILDLKGIAAHDGIQARVGQDAPQNARSERYICACGHIAGGPDGLDTHKARAHEDLAAITRLRESEDIIRRYFR